MSNEFSDGMSGLSPLLSKKNSSKNSNDVDPFHMNTGLMSQDDKPTSLLLPDSSSGFSTPKTKSQVTHSSLSDAPSSSNTKASLKKRRKKSKCREYSNCFITTLFLLFFITFSLIDNINIRKLNKTIKTEQDEIDKLNGIIHDHALVIARFNHSVTNSDVLAKVELYQSNLETTEANMQQRLDNSQKNINQILNKTIKELDDSIVAAKTEIHLEVEQVKSSINDYVRTTQDQFSMENSFMVYQLAGTFTVLGCLISMWHMTDHLRHLHEPFVQRKILAILWMCPIYSVTSWLSLVFVNYEGYFSIVKDFYEAYCIYTFLSFIIAVLGRGDREAVVTLLARHANHLSPPIRLCGWCYPNPYDNDRAMAHAVLLQCQVFAMQFVFCRPLITTLNFIFKSLNYYGSGTSASDWRAPQFYLSIINNISVFVAFSGLLKIYHAVQTDLLWYRPLPKFLCIKGVVFMTFWQGLVIGILARSTDASVTTSENGSEENVDAWAARAQNFLICLEMLLFSIAHFYVFPTEEWKPGYRPIFNSDSKFGDNIALRDFFSDVKLILGSDKHKLKRRKSKKKKKSKTTSSKSSTASESGDDKVFQKKSGDAEQGFFTKGDKFDDNFFCEGSDSVNEDSNDCDESRDDATSNKFSDDDYENTKHKFQRKLSTASSKDNPVVRKAKQRVLANPILLSFTNTDDTESERMKSKMKINPTQTQQYEGLPKRYKNPFESSDDSDKEGFFYDSARSLGSKSKEVALENSSLLGDNDHLTSYNQVLHIPKPDFVRPNILTAVPDIKGSEIKIGDVNNSKVIDVPCDTDLSEIDEDQSREEISEVEEL